MSKPNSRGLGKGFDALLPTNFSTEALQADDGKRIQSVAIEQLSRNENQPRTHFDELALEELAQSIKKHGILQPLVVTSSKAGHYVIVAGERRWRAAKLAGLKEVPVVVRTLKELEKLEIGLIENVQRVDLSPLEQAVSIARLHTEFNISVEEIAKRIGKAQTTILNIVRLLHLPEQAKQALHEGHISEGHARSILALKNTEQQLELLKLIITKGWSVRQTETYVKAMKQTGGSAKQAVQKMATTTPATERLAAKLSAPVSIKHTAKGGALVITFTSEEELERITSQLL